jgi:hypothetical protein
MRGSLFLLPIIVLAGIQIDGAQAHFFGETRLVDEYQIIFMPSPSVPQVGSNMTYLNFSVLRNNSNIFNVFSAVVITEKSSGKVVEQIPYSLYEFSDISIPYIFQEPGSFVITLQTRIAGDEKYQTTPLVASFDIMAENPGQGIPIDELMLYFVTPAAIAITGIVIYLYSKKRI